MQIPGPVPVLNQNYWDYKYKFDAIDKSHDIAPSYVNYSIFNPINSLNTIASAPNLPFNGNGIQDYQAYSAPQLHSIQQPQTLPPANYGNFLRQHEQRDQ